MTPEMFQDQIDTRYRIVTNLMVRRGYSANTRINIMLDFHKSHRDQTEVGTGLIELAHTLQGPVNSLVNPDLYTA